MSEPILSFALAEPTPGTIIAHTPDCPEVRAQAARGLPVATLYDCKAPLPDEYARHTCLPAKAT